MRILIYLLTYCDAHRFDSSGVCIAIFDVSHRTCGQRSNPVVIIAIIIMQKNLLSGDGLVEQPFLLIKCPSIFTEGTITIYDSTGSCREPIKLLYWLLWEPKNLSMCPVQSILYLCSLICTGLQFVSGRQFKMLTI